MGLFKDLKQLKQDIAEIKQILSGDLPKKADELKEIKELLPFVHLKVRSITDTIDENGKDALIVVYEAPQIVLRFDDNGNIMLNNVFRAINGLNLIDMEDQIKLLNSIKVKKE